MCLSWNRTWWQRMVAIGSFYYHQLQDFNITVLVIFSLNSSSYISLIFWEIFALCVFILYRAVFKGWTPIFSNCHQDCLIKMPVFTSVVPLFMFLLCLVFILEVWVTTLMCFFLQWCSVSWNITSFLFLHVAFFNLTSQSQFFFSKSIIHSKFDCFFFTKVFAFILNKYNFYKC